jgi:hypothetical protein
VFHYHDMAEAGLLMPSVGMELASANSCDDDFHDRICWFNNDRLGPHLDTDFVRRVKHNGIYSFLRC